MYEAYFHLQKRPFAATPDSSCCFPPGLAPALDELLQNARQGQGIGVLTGIPGIGKTLLCRRLMAELGHEFIVVFLGSASFSTRRALLQTILYELELPYNGLEEQELRLALQTFVKNLAEDGGAILLVVDEAHLLSERLLEEIRSLAILAEDGQPPIRVILAGNLALEEKLTAPTLEALRQLITIQVCLETLSTEQSTDYVRHRMNWAGGDADESFAPDALLAVARASGGIPRCLNQLSDHSLLLAFVGDAQQVLVEHVHDALQDLRQLPLHWQETLLSSGATDSQDPEATSESVEEFEAETQEKADEDDEILETGLSAASSSPAYSIEIGAAGDAFQEDQGFFGEAENQTVTATPDIQDGVSHDAHVLDPIVAADTSATIEPVADEPVIESEPIASSIKPVGSEPVCAEIPAGSCACENFNCTHRIWEPTISSVSAPGQTASISWHQPIYLVEEEVVFDRYAEIDSGLAFSAAYQNAPVGTPPRTVARRATQESERAGIARHSRPDQTLETQVLPLLDRLAEESLDESTDTRDQSSEVDSGTLEDQIYFDVFEVCSEVRQAILDHLPPEDLQLPSEEIAGGAPFDVIQPYDSPRDFMAGERSGHELDAQEMQREVVTSDEGELSQGEESTWAGHPDAYASESRHTVDAPAKAEVQAPNYKWIFSMLRRKSKAGR